MGSLGRALALLCAVIAPGRAAAEPDERPPQPASWRLVLSDLTVLRVNPLGLETRARFGLQKRLYTSEKQISANNFGFLGTFAKLNPASAHLGAGGELQPLSMFNLRAFAEVQRYFGSVGFLQSFPSANASYSDATLDDLSGTSRAASVGPRPLEPVRDLALGGPRQPLVRERRPGPVAVTRFKLMRAPSRSADLPACTHPGYGRVLAGS
jgi:hypothetical protein